jgi:hypothetical protein
MTPDQFDHGPKSYAWAEFLGLRAREAFLSFASHDLLLTVYFLMDFLSFGIGGENLMKN